MMKYAVALLVVFSFVLPMPALSQAMQCASVKTVDERLNEDYGETVSARFRFDNGLPGLLYKSEEKKTWTMVILTPAGMACIVLSGKEWGHIKNSPEKKGSPA